MVADFVVEVLDSSIPAHMASCLWAHLHQEAALCVVRVHQWRHVGGARLDQHMLSCQRQLAPWTGCVWTRQDPGSQRDTYAAVVGAAPFFDLLPPTITGIQMLRYHLSYHGQNHLFFFVKLSTFFPCSRLFIQLHAN